MLVRSNITAVNSSYTASISVETDSYEQTYIKAYGEPRIDTAGVIPYVDGAPVTSPVVVSSNIGTVPVSGYAVAYPAVGQAAYRVYGSGTLTGVGATANPGYFRGVSGVTGDFTARFAIFDNGVPPVTTAADGFIVGIAVFSAATDSAPGVVVGWGGHHSAYQVQHRARLAEGGNLTVVNAAALSDPTGLYLRLSRAAGLVTAEYSVDDQASWISLGTTSFATDPVRIGILVNSGGPGLLEVLIDDAFIVPANNGGPSFTLLGSPSLRYVRSQSPHQLTLDGKVDPDAKAKLEGWISVVSSRISAAKAALLENPNPADGADGRDKVIKV